MFLDMNQVPVDFLASILSNTDFLNIESNLQDMAILSKNGVPLTYLLVTDLFTGSQRQEVLATEGAL